MKPTIYTEEEKESIYNALREKIPGAMDLLEVAIKKGMPKYYIVDQIMRYKMPRKIREGVMVAINWKYKKLKTNEI